MEMRPDVRIVFMGTPEFATGPLRAIMEGGYNVVGVVTVPDKPSGRGLKLNVSAVKEYVQSLDRQIPILQPEMLKDREFLDELKSLDADLFVVVAFRMLPREVWAMPRLGTFNLHASLLPKYRGAAPINRAIMEGEKETGVTTFFLDDKMDTGAVLFQEEVSIGENENVGSLYDRLMSVGSALTLKTVDAIAGGKINPIPQQELPAPSLAPKITRETMEINWNDSAERIHNQVRGLSPYPASHTSIKTGETKSDIKIFASEKISENCSSGKPGKIHSDGKTFLEVDCGSGKLRITELQMAGKKRLTVRDFLAGWHCGWDDTYFGAF